MRYTVGVTASCSAVAIAVAIAQPAHAETRSVTVSPAAELSQQTAAASPAPQESADSAGAHVDDIVVTANRREQRLQDVPISVTAISAKSLDASGISATPQLGQVTPGLNLARNTAIFQPTIRGVGSRAATLGDESNVAIYIDGIYQPETYAGAFDLLEVERIEVLRGPQGTLFGRNATGGLINIITPDPSPVLRGSVALRYGSYNSKSARGYVSGPIAPNLSADLAGLIVDDGGYVTDIVRGGKVGPKKSWALRGKLMFEPSAGSRIILSGSYNYSNDQTAVITTPLNGNTIGARTVGAIIPRVPGTAALSFDPQNQVRQYGGALQTHWAFGSVAIDTATSYGHSSLFAYTDSDSSIVDTASTYNKSRNDNLSQEIRLTSTTAGPFQWIVGGFGFLDVGRYDPLEIRGVKSVVNSDLYARNLTRSLAGFAEGTYALTDRLKVTLGARYTWEARHFTARRVTPTTTASLDVQTSYRQLTPRASVQLELVKNVNAYVSYNKGFKSGVFSTGGLNPLPVSPEKLDAYEFGVKADPLPWLRTNLSFFYYSYDNIQVSVRDPTGVSILQNAAAATITGGEAEVTVAPTRDLNLRFGASVTDGTFDDFKQAIVTIPTGIGGNTQVGIDVPGKRVIRTPELTLSLAADYSHDFSFGKAGISGNVYYSSRYYFDYLNRVSQAPYVLVNGQVFVEPVHNLRVALWVENLTNRLVIQNLVSSTLADSVSYTKPRSGGVSVRFTF